MDEHVGGNVREEEIRGEGERRSGGRVERGDCAHEDLVKHQGIGLRCGHSAHWEGCLKSDFLLIYRLQLK